MYEYKVVFAPTAKKRSLKFWKGDQSATNLSDMFNDLALENWEYQTSEKGLGGAGDMLVFRREIPKLEEAPQREVAKVIAPETFERPIVPRRPRPAAYGEVQPTEFRASRSEKSADVTPLRLETPIVATQ